MAAWVFVLGCRFVENEKYPRIKRPLYETIEYTAHFPSPYSLLSRHVTSHILGSEMSIIVGLLVNCPL